MAIGTFAELQTALDNWLDHTLYQAREPEFIALAESWMNRRVRVRQQMTTATITTTSGTGTLPADYLEWIRATLQSEVPQNLEYLPPDVLQTVYPSVSQIAFPAQSVGFPGNFTIEGSSILVRPIDDSDTVELVYYAKIPALSASNTTNWLLTAHPDLYLWATLTEASMFGTNDPRAQSWRSRREEVLEEVLDLYQASLGVGSQRAWGPTP